MPAIITDQFRITNAETFVQSFAGIGTTSYYYSFLGHPDNDNSTVENYKSVDVNGEPIAPKDSFQQEDLYHDSMLFMKRISSGDIARVVPRIDWQSGSTYDMYKNSVDRDGKTNVTKSSNLYDSKYYIVNSEYKVYVCINNGSSPDANGNMIASKSLIEPNFVDLVPQVAGNGADGYLWKYLFTIKPSDVIRFSTDDYIPVPSNWGDINTSSIKNSAVDGKLETALIKSRGSSYKFNPGGGLPITDTYNITNVKIYGDGDGEARASVKITSGEVTEVTITNGGSGYTRAHLELNSRSAQGVTSSTEAKFEVIIPPKGGHGADIYRELGAYRVLLYSKFDDTVEDRPDYVTGNNFSRVGVIKDPIRYGSTTNELINTTTATTLGALKLTGDTSQTEYPNNKQITMVHPDGAVSVGLVASWNKNTKVLKYYQPVGFSTQQAYGYELKPFVGLSTTIYCTATGAQNNRLVDTTFSGDSDTTTGTNLGQSFTNGHANPDVDKYSGDIIYIDNRNTVTRSSTQKEEVKIIIEF
tara:strand:+ start:16662 stop:18245 length:1584 start_codon:yes stop_codon:yes gene_type:complete